MSDALSKVSSAELTNDNRIDPPCDETSVALAQEAQERDRASFEAENPGLVICRTCGVIHRNSTPGCADVTGTAS